MYLLTEKCREIRKTRGSYIWSSHTEELMVFYHVWNLWTITTPTSCSPLKWKIVTLQIFFSDLFQVFPICGREAFGEMGIKKACFVWAAFQLSQNCRLKLSFENINNSNPYPHLIVCIVPVHLYHQIFCGKEGNPFMETETAIFSFRNEWCLLLKTSFLYCDSYVIILSCSTNIKQRWA